MWRRCLSVCGWGKEHHHWAAGLTERVALWGVIGPPAYSLQPIHRKNGCLGGSGGFFPRVVPKLRRDLLFFRALWSPFGSAWAFIPAAGAMSAGNVHRLAGLFCVVGCDVGGKAFTPPLRECKIVRALLLVLLCAFGRFNSIKCSLVVFATVP